MHVVHSHRVIERTGFSNSKFCLIKHQIRIHFHVCIDNLQYVRRKILKLDMYMQGNTALEFIMTIFREVLLAAMTFKNWYNLKPWA